MTATAQHVQQTVYGDGNVVVGIGDVTVVKPAPLSDSERDTRRSLGILMQRVRAGWIEGVLDKALSETAMLELRYEAQAQRVDAARLLPQETPSASRPTSPGKPLLEIFEEAGRMLLILGEPGSGKTIALLRMARDLLDQAARDPNFGLPVPVVFNLSSWNGSLSLLEWMAQELGSKYGMARSLGQQWLRSYRVLPLLDGLDEVRSELRAACVQAINRLVTETGTSGIVVCSRSAEYNGLGARLLLNAAIGLLPLEDRQVLAFLDAAGPRLAALRAAIAADPQLMEMARSPLTLNILCLAYENAPAQELAQSAGGAVERRRRLFDAYIARMLGRKVQGGLPYDPVQVVWWLSWLARKMVDHGQTVFLIEQMQPSWLETRAQRWKYVMAARVFANMLITGLGFMAGFFNGLLVGLVDGLYFDRQAARPQPAAPGWGRRILYVAQIVLLFLVLNSLSYLAILGPAYLLLVLNDAPPDVLSQFMEEAMLRSASAVLVGGFPSLLIGIRGSGQTLRRDIRTVETIHWSWKKAFQGSALYGAGFGFLGALLTVILTFSMGLNDVLSVAVILCLGLVNWIIYFAILAFPFSGLTSKLAEGKLAPNQGIRMSIRNAWRAGLGVSLALGLMFGVLFTGFVALATGYMALTGEVPLTLNTLFTSALLALAVTALFVFLFVLGVGPMATAWYGGFDAIYHYSLRYRMEKEGLIPEHYERFLDFAAERIFLRKVGGGYLFVHRLLMEHFAARK